MQRTIHSPQQRSFITLLRQIRQEAGLTQVQRAERLDIPQTWISNYERGERKLDVLELRQVCRAVGVPFLDFMARLDGELSKLEISSSDTRPAFTRRVPGAS